MINLHISYHSYIVQNDDFTINKKIYNCNNLLKYGKFYSINIENDTKYDGPIIKCKYLNANMNNFKNIEFDYYSIKNIIYTDCKNNFLNWNYYSYYTVLINYPVDKNIKKIDILEICTDTIDEYALQIAKKIIINCDISNWPVYITKKKKKITIYCNKNFYNVPNILDKFANIEKLEIIHHCYLDFVNVRNDIKKLLISEKTITIDNIFLYFPNIITLKLYINDYKGFKQKYKNFIINETSITKLYINGDLVFVKDLNIKKSNIRYKSIKSAKFS